MAPGVWGRILQNPTLSAYVVVDWFKTNDLHHYLYTIGLQHPELFSAYQENNNMYSASGNGVKQYFDHIKQFFGQAIYDNILSSFYGSSTTYTDSFNISEHHIYGSSRLGVNKTGINLAYAKVTTTNTSGGELNNITTISSLEDANMDFQSFYFIRGNKNYELTNHLGNVLTVITDKKLQVCSTTVVSYYVADVIAAQDYSPFGAPLPGRSYDLTKEQSRHIVLQNTFASSAEGWSATNGNSSVTTISGQLKITVNAANASARAYVSTLNGKDYKYKITVDLGTSSAMVVYVKDDVSGNTLGTLTVTYSGTYTVKFKATSGNSYIYAGQSGTYSSSKYFYVDDVSVEEDMVVQAGYRFAFNGKEKDNETYGDGNEYDYGARIYNPGLGSWLSVDPLQSKYPNLSPYVFVANSPLMFYDPDGKGVKPMNEGAEKALQVLLARNPDIKTTTNNGVVRIDPEMLKKTDPSKLKGEAATLFKVLNALEIVEVTVTQTDEARTTGDGKGTKVLGDKSNVVNNELTDATTVLDMSGGTMTKEAENVIYQGADFVPNKDKPDEIITVQPDKSGKDWVSFENKNANPKAPQLGGTDKQNTTGGVLINGTNKSREQIAPTLLKAVDESIKK